MLPGDVSLVERCRFENHWDDLLMTQQNIRIVHFVLCVLCACVCAVCLRVCVSVCVVGAWETSGGGPLTGRCRVTVYC